MTDELISRESVIALCRDISEAAISVPVERAFKRMVESIPALPAVQPQVAAPDVAGLVERLKAKRLVFGVGDPNGFQDYVNLDGKEAAATITRLDRDLQAARAEVERLRAALGRIESSRARTILPWTHEAAADEYSRMLDDHRHIARAAIRACQEYP